MTFWKSIKDLVETFSGHEAPKPERDLDEEEVRLAAAALLVHATVVDGTVDRREGEVLRDVLERRFNLDHGAAGRLIQEAAEREAEAVDLYGFTSVLTRRLDREGRLKIVEMMWEVVIADGVIHEFEANLVWRAAELLGVTSRDRIMLRKRVESRHG
ncbi:MAG: TerB family tellurite resistance protein [Alphaproteobacteria bacterium]|nr:MAG: TerB family tellurite resistance protein [Alphaproteobacteria bacterium]